MGLGEAGACQEGPGQGRPPVPVSVPGLGVKTKLGPSAEPAVWVSAQGVASAREDHADVGWGHLCPSRAFGDRVVAGLGEGGAGPIRMNMTQVPSEGSGTDLLRDEGRLERGWGAGWGVDGRSVVETGVGSWARLTGCQGARQPLWPCSPLSTQPHPPQGQGGRARRLETPFQGAETAWMGWPVSSRGPLQDDPPWGLGRDPDGL